MGGGDLNAKKAWHPNTLKNQERVWKAEQAAAEEKKRIVELERERHLERERAELNKLAKSSLAHSSLPGDDRLHWMYEKPDKTVQQEEYLLGKSIEKNHEQSEKSVADEIPAVSRRVVGSSMLTAAGDTQVDLARKLREDPLLLVKERERAARAALLNNPVQRARLAELLRNEQKSKNENKLKKKKKKSKDLDNILAEKLQALSGKKGIDLASLLASEDSSSESSNEKSKKKTKKNKKKSKSKIVASDDSDLEDKHEIKYDSKYESKKAYSEKHKKDTNRVSVNSKSMKRHHSVEKESTKLSTRKHRHSSEDDHSSDNNLECNNDKQNHKSKYVSKHESKKHKSSDKPKKANNENDRKDAKKKKTHHSIENESKTHSKTYRRNTSEDCQSSDDQQSYHGTQPSKPYVNEDRYWSQKQYSSDYQKLKVGHNSRYEWQHKDDKYAKGEGHSKDQHSWDNLRKYEREDKHRDVTYRNNGRMQKDSKNQKDKYEVEQNLSTSDKGWRNNKRSGLSEAEKASRLAEMMVAGAEREKQRERRVADQLAEKEKEEKPSSHSRGRNVVQQLPDSLESRIHSNRHYIQRDQRHMNENFARR